MQTSLKEKKNTFLKWYEDFKTERDNQTDNWELARSTSVELNDLIKKIEFSFTIVEGRIKSGKTYALLFDSKDNKHDTVLDLLIDNRISYQLDSKRDYYVKCDSNAKIVKSLNNNEKSNKVDKILVPVGNWPLPENVRLNISHDNYVEFLQNLQEKGFFIDLVILTLKSKEAFKNGEIRCLLKKIKDKELNMIILFNDAPKMDCTYWKDCDICYEETRTDMESYGLPPEDRFLKISSKKSLERNSPPRSKDKAFEGVIKIIKDELSMDAMVGRFLKGADLFMSKFEEFKKIIDEVKKNVENKASNYESILEENKEETEETIKQTKSNIEAEFNREINEFVNVEKIDKTFMKMNVEPIIDNRFREFRETFKKQIREMVRSDNPALETYITTMYFTDYMREQDYEIKLKTTMENCLEEILKEFENENLNSKLVLENFLQKTKHHITETFESISESYTLFRENFKNDVITKLEQFEETIETANSDYTECLRKEFLDTIERKLPSIFMKTEMSINLLEKNINSVMNEIKDKIQEKKLTNLYEDCITNYFRLDDNMHFIFHSFESNLTSLKDDIVDVIKNIGSDPQTTIWISDITESFKTNWLHEIRINEFEQLINEKFQNIYFKSEIFYTSDVPHAIIRKELELYGANLEDFTEEETQQHIERIRAIRRGSSKEIKLKLKYVNDDLMIRTVEDVKNCLICLLNSIKESIRKNIEGCICDTSSQT